MIKYTAEFLAGKEFTTDVGEPLIFCSDRNPKFILVKRVSALHKEQAGFWSVESVAANLRSGAWKLSHIPHDVTFARGLWPTGTILEVTHAQRMGIYTYGDRFEVKEDTKGQYIDTPGVKTRSRETLSRFSPVTCATPEPNDTVEPKDVSAVGMLKEAADCIGDRAAERDTDAERSMAATVKAFNGMYGTSITEQMGWQFMVLLKMSRAKGGDFRRDDFVDGAAYFALAGECSND